MNQEPEHTGDKLPPFLAKKPAATRIIDGAEIEYGLTQSMGNYNNVRVSVRLRAEIYPDGSVDEAIRALVEQSRAKCEQAIDNALEQAGESPVYTKEPLYILLKSLSKRVFAVVPHDTDHIGGCWNVGGPRRLAAMKEQATIASANAGWTWLDCSESMDTFTKWPDYDETKEPQWAEDECGHDPDNPDDFDEIGDDLDDEPEIHDDSAQQALQRTGERQT